MVEQKRTSRSLATIFSGSFVAGQLHDQSPQIGRQPAQGSAISFQIAERTSSRLDVPAKPKVHQAEQDEEARILQAQQQSASISAMSSDIVRDIATKHTNRKVQERLAEHQRTVQEQLTMRRIVTVELASQLRQALLQRHVHDRYSSKVAELYDARRSKRQAWRRILLRCGAIKARNVLQAAEAAETAARLASYQSAFKSLDLDKTLHSSRGTTQMPASSSSLHRSKAMAQKFWDPLTDDLYSEVNRASDAEDWSIVALTSSSQFTSWITQKLNISSDCNHREFFLRNLRFSTYLNKPVSSDLQLGALLIEVPSGYITTTAFKTFFLSYLQSAAALTSHRFPILFIHLGFTERSDVWSYLQLDDVMKDRKTPVTACELVNITSINDIDAFETAFIHTLQATSAENSVLALEREEQSSMLARRQPPTQQRPSSPIQPRPRNSFYKLEVHNQFDRHMDLDSFAPAQVSSELADKLKQNVELARKLLKQ